MNPDIDGVPSEELWKLCRNEVLLVVHRTNCNDEHVQRIYRCSKLKAFTRARDAISVMHRSSVARVAKVILKLQLVSART